MKKLLLIALSLIVLLVAAFVLVGLFLPKDYDVSRTAVINATPEEIHALVGDLERWPEFMPWEEGDPTIETKIVKSTGADASQTWTGNSGNGTLTFFESDPATGIGYEMLIDKWDPSKGYLNYEALEDGTTRVTWRMEGNISTPIIGPYFAASMDAMVGPMFHQGLQRLKSILETEDTDEPASEIDDQAEPANPEAEATTPAE